MEKGETELVDMPKKRVRDGPDDGHHNGINGSGGNHDGGNNEDDEVNSVDLIVD